MIPYQFACKDKPKLLQVIKTFKILTLITNAKNLNVLLNY